MREADLSEEIDVRAASGAERRGRPLADAVDGENGGILKRGRIERGSGVRDVVLGKEDRNVGFDFLLDAIRKEELLGQPDRHRRSKRGRSLGRAGKISLEQALELEERLVVERDGIELIRPDSPDLEARSDRILRELGIVLDAREAFFLGGSHDLPVLDETGGGVVVPSAHTKNVQRSSFKRGFWARPTHGQRLLNPNIRNGSSGKEHPEML